MVSSAAAGMRVIPKPWAPPPTDWPFCRLFPLSWDSLTKKHETFTKTLWPTSLQGAHTLPTAQEPLGSAPLPPHPP